MHDPSTVAWRIPYPWRKYGSKGQNEFERSYREAFITIWHVDPERGVGHGNRADDSCGWHTPPTTREQRDHIAKIGREQWFSLFRRRDQKAKGDPEGYAYICYEPTTYDAVYWAWRRIKREDTKHQWVYGGYRHYLTRSELDHIYSLASNPVDNLQVTVAGVKDEESCAEFFLCVYRAYLRHHRPWWRHPRWHFWHWQIQVHPWQQLRRRLFDRCAHCGKPFINTCPVSHSWHSEPPGWFQSRKGLYHDECSNVVVSTDRAMHEKNIQGVPVH